MTKQNDGLSEFMPKTLGTNKQTQMRQKVAGELDDDDYEVEEAINDPMMAMMPMSFGKQSKKKDLSASFAKTKRVTTQELSPSIPDVKERQTQILVNSVDEDDDSDDDFIGPMPAEAENSEEGQDDEDDEFPISHEIVLKDHTKVTPIHARPHTRRFQRSLLIHQVHD